MPFVTDSSIFLIVLGSFISGVFIIAFLQYFQDTRRDLNITKCPMTDFSRCRNTCQLWDNINLDCNLANTVIIEKKVV
jgi:hypothetical protein